MTGGTQMGALEVLVADIVCEAGLKRLDVRTRTALELPGYFRATKKWDLIVVSEVRNKEPYFPVDPLFRGEDTKLRTGDERYAGVSYGQRYELLCRRLVLGRLYTSACFLMATNSDWPQPFAGTPSPFWAAGESSSCRQTLSRIIVRGNVSMSPRRPFRL